MKLYASQSAAVNPMRVRTLLAYKKIDIDIVELDLGAGEHKQPDYLAINSFGQVPVLQKDDGTYLYETEVICRYLEHLYPTPNLCGNTFDEQLPIDMSERQIVNNFTQPLIQFFKHSHPSMANRVKQNTEWAALCAGTVKNNAGWIEKQLANKQFIACNRLTMADITLSLTLKMADRINFTGFADSQILKNYVSYIDAVLQA